MKWNASLAAALSLSLAACGASGGTLETAPEPAGPLPGSPDAQTWDGEEDRARETWRGADGTIRTRERRPVRAAGAAPLIEAEPIAPSPMIAQRPGATYAPPGRGAAATSEPIYALPPLEESATAASTPARPPLSRPAPRPVAPVAASPMPQDMADPTSGMTGPRGSSQPGAGERRHDEVGYAGLGTFSGEAPETAVVGAHRALPVDSLVEVTSLESGRTILVLITGSLPPGSGPAMELSVGAARQLGASGATLPVRVRRVSAGPQDLLALRAGQPAGLRADAPPVLLTALRKRLGAAPMAVAAPVPPSRPVRAPVPPRAARPAPAGRYLVQVAALSNASNAQALARSFGGSVRSGAGLHRVQLGPFATSAEAERARAGAARAGYHDARVITN